jgi:hypothetical protein
MKPSHQLWRFPHGRQITSAEPASALRHGLPENPCHAGVIQRQSGMHLVFEFLAKSRRCYFSTKEVRQGTGLPLGAVPWALFRLSRQAWIEVTSGVVRIQRYLQCSNPGDKFATSEKCQGEADSAAREAQCERDQGSCSCWLCRGRG